MKRLIGLVSLLAFTSSFACEVKIPSHLLVLGDGVPNLKLIQAKDCSEKTIQDLYTTIIGLEGKIRTQELANLVSQKDNTPILFKNESTNIIQLSSLIRNQLQLPLGTRIKSTRSPYTANVLPIAPGDQVEVSCSSCNFHQEQSINVSINGFDGSRTPMTVSATFSRLVKAYRIISPVQSFSEVSNFEGLKEEYVESVPYTDLITDLSSLKFFKTNKPLRVGDLLRKNDLNPISLVKAGLKTEVIIESQVVRIKTHGISRSNGTIGELVEVFHPQKNKKYQGKVIDINKVLVEL